MRQKLTNEEIDKRLIESDRKIVRIDDYPGKNTIKIKWMCLVDGYVWEGSTSNILNNRGCPKCSGSLPLTNEIVDNGLTDRNIKRLSDYPGRSNIKMKWKCLVDGHEWDAITSNILHPKRPTGCPVCNTKKITPEKIDNIIKELPYKRQHECLEINKIKLQCLKCLSTFDIIYQTMVYKIKKEKCLCKQCELKNKIDSANSKIDTHLKETKIKRISDFSGWGDKMVFVDDTGYSWSASPLNILGKKTIRNLRPRLNNTIIDNRLKYRNIKRVGSYVDKDTPIDFKCEITGDVWKCLPNNIFRGHGNPRLGKNTHKREKDIFNYLRNIGIDFTYHKKIEDVDRKYYVDFFIEKVNTIIEYNGKQHYCPIDIFGGEKAFSRQIKRDTALRKYCRNKNINLVEISYKLSWQSILEIIDTIVGAKTS